MRTVSLTEEQRAKAIAILKGLSEGDVQSPTDIVDTWEAPSLEVDFSNRDGSIRQFDGMVPPSRIKGSATASVDRLVPKRLAKVLEWMLEGEYELRHWRPPVLQKLEDFYYVTSDGVHRCLAAKAIGLENLYVEYEDIPPHRLIEKDPDSNHPGGERTITYEPVTTPLPSSIDLGYPYRSDSSDTS